jgi:hypothetical protein
MGARVAGDWAHAGELGAAIAQSVSQANGREKRGANRMRLLCIANIENGTVNRECAKKGRGNLAPPYSTTLPLLCNSRSHDNRDESADRP